MNCESSRKVTTVAVRTELRVVDGMAVVNGSLLLEQLLPLKIAAFFLLCQQRRIVQGSTLSVSVCVEAANCRCPLFPKAALILII